MFNSQFGKCYRIFHQQWLQRVDGTVGAVADGMVAVLRVVFSVPARNKHFHDLQLIWVWLSTFTNMEKSIARANFFNIK